MNSEFKEIITGIKRSVALLTQKERKSLVVATGLMILTGVLTNLPAVILGNLTDSLIDDKSFEFSLVLPYITLIVVIILIREALTVYRKYLVENIATQTDKEQTVRVIERLLKTNIKDFLYKQQIGSLHGRIFRSMQGLIQVIKLVFLNFAPIFFTAVAAVVIALYQRPFIAAVMILVIPAGLYIIVRQISSQKGIRVALARGKEQVDGKVVEMLGGIETIRVLDTVETEVQKIEVIAENQRKIEIKHHIQMALYDAAKYLNEGFFYIVVIILSIFLASKGIITRGDILVYSILFVSITSPLREIHRILDQAHENSLRVNDLYDLLHQPMDPSFHEKHLEKTEEIKKAIIDISDVSFSFNPEKTILNHISLKVNSGESIGIVGSSGCGKTTLVHILLKLIHSYSGKITLFSNDLNSISRKSIAETVAYVSQKPFIFSGTVKENILYGHQHSISEEEMVEAAKKANIYNEIMHDLGGFDGKVSESGNNLSGGQKQRLAIARVMLKQPELIIFDEATSALDNTNEAIIQKNIETQFKGKTMITIAHRLSTLKNCDRILVFDKGNIVQEGTYDKLANEQGLFQDFLKQRTA
ncbi:MAG: ABC transporter ATP-binding protein [Patescibacteria group bacterium]